jgi:hypothetical protein
MSVITPEPEIFEILYEEITSSDGEAKTFTCFRSSTTVRQLKQAIAQGVGDANGFSDITVLYTGQELKNCGSYFQIQ